MGARINRGTRAWVGVIVAVLGSAMLSPAAASAASAPVLAGSVRDSTDLSEATSVAAASVSGHTYAYATAYHSGQLTAVDVSLPASPIVVGTTPPALPANPTSPLLNGSNIALAGGYAYVVSKNHNNSTNTSNDDGSGNALTILDVHTNPGQPTVVGSVQDPVKLFGSYGIAVRGNYAYIAAQGCIQGDPCPNRFVGNTFVVVDISNPASPKIVASLQDLTLLSHATSVAISGNYAYVTASYQNRLTVVDISNPLAPKMVASIQDPRLHFDVDIAIQGNYAYIADQSNVGMTIVDISNPLNPRITGASNSNFLNGGYRIRVRGDFAYVSAAFAGTVAAVDISNPTAPRTAGVLYNPFVLHSTTGLDLDPTTHQVIATSPSLPGPSVTPPIGTVSVITLDPSPIAVAIHQPSEPTNPTTKTTASFSFATSDQVFTPRCQLDGAPASLCTSPSTQQYSSLRLGSHVFTLQGIDASGAVATTTYKWKIVTAPQITKFRQSKSRWRRRVGTRFSFNLSQAATVKFVFTHSVPGRKVKGKCVGQTKKNKHNKKCQRTVTALTATIAERQGANHISFHGTLLSTGRYTLTATASLTGLVSKPKTLKFTILRG